MCRPRMAALPRLATAVKRSHPHSIVISYQGDGDLSAIGAAEILHAANRGENITVIFVNNAIYSMTGGQVAPTTLLGQKSTTTPKGRNVANEGYPLRMSELLATLDAPVYIERVGLGDNKQIAQASRAIRRAVENQVRGLGFSLVEVLSPCPTIWKMSAGRSAALGARCDGEDLSAGRGLRPHQRPRAAHLQPNHAPRLEEIPAILGIGQRRSARWSTSQAVSGVTSILHVRVAGFGGQGVLLLGEVLAEAGLDAGLEVSWLPSYGPEMRSGTSNCHVRVSQEPIDSPLVTVPNFLVAMNEPSLRKFDLSVRPGGWVIYNGDDVPGRLRAE